MMQMWIAEGLQPGDRAVDATAGNGYDTLFLAEQVGAAGHVYAVDLQTAAIESARQRLITAGCHERVTFLHGNHAELMSLLPEDCQRTIAVVMFNLGYLPGSDRELVTTPESTLHALDAALGLLRPGGVLSVVSYWGHPGGAEEGQMVEDWFRQQSHSGRGTLCQTPVASSTAPRGLLLRTV